MGEARQLRSDRYERIMNTCSQVHACDSYIEKGIPSESPDRDLLLGEIKR